MAFPIQWTPIREQYLYGYRATSTHAPRAMAEVVRAYSGEWCVFCYVNGAQVSRPDLADTRYGYATARKHAAAFVQHWVGA